MNKANECTCPSGDGSLVHPCPAHPAVDQADVAAKLTFINGRPAMCGCQVEYSDGGGEYSDVIYVTLCAKHSGSAILDLVATNRIALTPEYEGQWHADLYLDREIPLAKVEGATPAEAVLALMSAERIDPEQESVEQAGGDERAVDGKPRATKCPDCGEGDLMPGDLCACGYETDPAAGYACSECDGSGDGYVGEVCRECDGSGWFVTPEQARAALAQPSPTLPPFAEKVLAKLRRFNECAEDSDSGGVDIGRHWLDLLTQLGLLNRVQRSPALWEISQQGEDLLGLDVPEIEVPDSMIEKAWQRFERTLQQLETPGQAEQAEQAEVERPEVVARVVHSNPIVLGQCGPLNANDELMTVAQHAASVARWAEMFNRVEQQRDAALARVAEMEAKLSELEKQEPLLHINPLVVDELLGRAKRSPGGLTWSKGRCEYWTLPLYAAPPAQAQHSVPGKYDDVLLPFLKSMEHELHANAGKGDRPGWLQMDRKTALLEIYYHLGKLQKATKGNDTAGIVEYAADVANMSMMLVDVCGLLADAPGKEGNDD